MTSSNPKYDEFKERIAMQMMPDDSEFHHPMQNELNTVTFVSDDKEHEIEIEISDDDSILFNIISVNPTKRESFMKLLHGIQANLLRDNYTKVYQNVVLSDWELTLQNIPGVRFVRLVNEGIPHQEFVIIEHDTADIAQIVTTAMAMNIDSHLDRKS